MPPTAKAMPTNATRRACAIVVSLAMLPILLTTHGTTPAAAAVPAEVELLHLLNDFRGANGRSGLVFNEALADQARSWSSHMVAAGTLAHHPQLGAEVGQVVPDWTRAGENVGYGPSAVALHEAFAASSGHRSNMLGGYNQVGIGVAVDHKGAMWATFRFVMGSLPPAPPPPTDSAPPTGVVVNPQLPETVPSASFGVGWYGQDSGSGIARFTIDVSDNGGGWVHWFDSIGPHHSVPPAASGSGIFTGTPGHSYAFRVQAEDFAGNVSEWSASPSTTISSNASNPNPYRTAYTASRSGDIGAVNSTPIAGVRWPFDAARGLAAHPGGGAYLLDAFGGVYPLGGAPALRNSAYWPGWDAARGLAINPDGRGGYVLDAFGGLHPVGNASPTTVSSYWNGWDIARGIALASNSTASRPAGWVMDAWGGIHPFGAAPKVQDSPYWPGWPMARAIVANPSGRGGYTLDAWGGLHAWGGAPNLSVSGYWRGWDIARSIALYPTSRHPAGYTLDGWGGLHPVGGAPVRSTTRQSVGTDRSRFITISS